MPTMLPAFPMRRTTLTLILASLLVGCSGQGAKDASKHPTQVGYIVAQPSTVPLAVTLNGRTVAFETSEVRPQVNGVIVKRYFTEGSYVRAGQQLFQIDSSLYRAAVNQAQADLTSARATAEAASAKADRYKPLADMEAVAKQDYADALATARSARASIAQNAAALDTAKTNLRFTTVPAPISGRIGRSLFTVGALASASQADPLAVIQRMDPIYVDMQQSAADITALRRRLAAGGINPGSTTVHLKFDDGSKYAYAGTVQFSEVTVDEGTGTVTLRAKFPNPDGLLLPGMFVSAIFDQANDPNAFLIPQNAVQRDFDGSAFVMTAGDDGKAGRRKVVADRTSGAYVVVTSGLQPGDKVIVQGLNGLKLGTEIKAVPSTAPQKVEPRAAKPGEAGAKGH
ncbi:membrane fusion protein (multidrug efflux system) [Novosphingobium sp. PhB165]|uniref:efflux RND transporter periplasmic adaptor subunit n=1 Tax=Novosphingobium sp. PhB165 TaxID=2485105 RepID=UPI001047E10D|nr:efflux RND transporter periplasmic adaptor subunit [Novosphingobium sp. PhB165]TCM21820.1 membrane fusion protein (multidrug efflux system) [Novosphingobium sp. PhB165]